MQKTHKKVFKIIDKIVMSILIAFIIITTILSVFFTYYKSQNKAISLFGYSIFYVITPSMEPELIVGDVILVKSVDAEDINFNDIITYKSNYGLLSGNYITHRVDSIEGEGDSLIFRTKGDANDLIDEEIVTADKIMGVFQQKLAFIKFIMSLLSNKLVFLLIVIAPLFGFLVMHLINFFTEIKKQ